MALEDFFIKPTIASTRQLKGVSKELDKPETKAFTFTDTLLALPRGLEGTVQGIYSGIDKLLLKDALPDYDTRLLGRSSTMVGGLAEGLVQFVGGFIPIAGQVGKVGQLARLAKLTGSRKRAIQIRRGAPLTPKEHKFVKNLKPNKKAKIAEAIGAGALTDFSVFNGQEERLANLVNAHPVLANPISEFLAAKEGDTELEGRFKNVLEGMVLELGLGGLGAGLYKSIKMIKDRRNLINKGVDPEEASEIVRSKSDLTEEEATYSNPNQDEFEFEDGVELPNTPYKDKEGQWYESDDGVSKPISVEQAARDRAEEDELINQAGQNYDKELADLKASRKTDFDESANVSAETPVDPETGVVSPVEERDLPMTGDQKRLDRDKPFTEKFKDEDPNPYQDPDAGPSIFEENRRFNEQVERNKIEREAREKAAERRRPEDVEVPKVETKVNEDGQIEIDLEKYGEKTVIEAPKKGATEEETLKNLGDYFKRILDTGGAQAVFSSLKTVGNSDEVAVIAGVLARHFAKNDTTTSIDELYRLTREENQQYLNQIGGDYRQQMAGIERHKNNVEELKRIRSEQKVLYQIQESLGENLTNRAKEAHDLIAKYGNKSEGPEISKAKAQVLNALEVFGESQRMWGLYGREFSLGLLSRKIMYKNGHKGRSYKNRQFGLDEKLMEVDAARKAYQQKVAGSMDDNKFIELLSKAASLDDVDEKLTALNKLTMRSRLSNGFDMVREYWINALLSGPSTQVVNTLGNLLTMNVRNFETTIGAALSGNKDLTRAMFDLNFMFTAVRDSIKMANLTLKSGEGHIVGAGRQAFQDTAAQRGTNAAISSERGRLMGAGKLLDKQDPLFGTSFGQALDMFGSLVRTPSSLLLYGDEFFKSMNYRMYIQTELASKAYASGKRGKALAASIQKEFDAHITQTGRMYNEESLYADAIKDADEKGLRFAERREHIERHVEEARLKSDRYSSFGEEERMALAERAKQASLINTHTADVNKFGVPLINKFVSEVPLASFVIPFIRTPANILGFGLSRTPIGLPLSGTKLYKLHAKKSRGILDSGDKRAIAEETGKLATAAFTMGGLLYYLEGNKDNITGYGPTDRLEREAWKNAGNQEYSFRVGNKWISYQRLDPMATTVGVLADISEQIRFGDFEGDSLQRIGGMLSLVIKNNITNKSYVEGLDNLFKVIGDTEKHAGKFVANIGAGFVPNIFNQSMNYQEERLLRETRKSLDYLIKRNPLKADTLPPKRTPLGDVMSIKPQGIGQKGGIGAIFNPFYVRDIKDDLVDNEIAALGGIGKINHKMANGNLDLRDFVNPDGRQAYDRYAELSGTTRINGQTLREALATAIRQPEYQRLEHEVDDVDGINIDSPRMKVLKSIIGAYRGKAQFEMFQEFPEAQSRLNEFHQAKNKAFN